MHIPVAHSLWTALDQCNTSLGQTLARLTELHERDQHAYVETVRWVAGLQSRQVRQSFLTFVPEGGRLDMYRSGLRTQICRKSNRHASKLFMKLTY